MTRNQARSVIGAQPKWALRAMSRALAIHSWQNNADEWTRAEALRVLGYRKAPKRRHYAPTA